MAVNTAQASQTVVAAALIGGSLSFFHDAKGAKIPPPKTIAAWFFAAVVLAAVAEFEPEVAFAFALMLIIVSVMAIPPSELRFFTGQAGPMPHGLGSGQAGNPVIAAPGGANPDPQLRNPAGGGLAGPPRIGFTR